MKGYYFVELYFLGHSDVSNALMCQEKYSVDQQYTVLLEIVNFMELLTEQHSTQQ